MTHQVREDFMRTMRPKCVWLTGAVAAMFCIAPAVHAQQPEPYPATLHFGTGLVNIPVAWVSPNNSDVWVQTSAKTIKYAPNQNFATYINTNISIDTHFYGRVSIGASAYDQNPDYGFFGQVLLLKPNQFRFSPAVAVGVRNVGNCKTETRLLNGCDISLGPDSAYHRGEVFKNFKTDPTIYGVATQEVSLGNRMGGSTASFTVGYGNGLFSDDGGLGTTYNKSGQLVKGLFLGARVTSHPSLNTGLTFMLENDGWDWNIGGLYDWRGITLGLYATELEEGPLKGSSYGVFNYTKANVSLGYSGNLIDISKGVILRTRITELTREQERLRLEIKARERRIRGLEVALRKAQAGELAGIEQKRRVLETQVNDEREQIRQANERLRAIQEGRTTPPATPPSTPPSNPPAL
jgi:hypothetical protein